MSDSLRKNIPDFMKAERRWVGFKLFNKSGQEKPAKIPINPHNGASASSTDPNTHGTFEEALAAMLKYGLNGIGFVLGNGWMGIDIDHAIEDGVIKPAARKIDEAFSFAYSEKSISGTGLHYYFIGSKGEYTQFCKIADFDNHGSDLEIYDEGRYFVVSGDALRAEGYVAEDAEKTEAGLKMIFDIVKDKIKPKSQIKVINPVEAPEDDEKPRYPDEKVIQIASRLKNIKDFRAMLAGENPFKNGDKSTNDYVVCKNLYIAGGTYHQIKRIIKSSKRHRSKHDETRTPYGTWLDLTLVQAIAEIDSERGDELILGDEGIEETENISLMPSLVFEEDDLLAIGIIEKSDYDHSKLFHFYSKNILISTLGRGFLSWNGFYWVEGKHIGKRLVIDFIEELQEYRNFVKSKQKKTAIEVMSLKSIEDAISDLKFNARMESMLSISTAQLEVSDDLLDSRWDLLNSPDGVIDLRSGIVSEAKSEY